MTLGNCQSNQFRPALLALGERTLPSMMAIAPVNATPHSATVHQHHDLTGLGHGEFHKPDGMVADLGTTYQMHGWGRLRGMGRVSVEGTVTGVGFVQTGKASGRLTFANASGSVTVAIDGPLQSGFSTLPHYFHYHVVAQSGDYHIQDSGTLRLDFTVNVAAGANPHGSFRMAI